MSTSTQSPSTSAPEGSSSKKLEDAAKDANTPKEASSAPVVSQTKPEAEKPKVVITLTSVDGRNWVPAIEGLGKVPIYPVHLERGWQLVLRHLRAAQQRLIAELKAAQLKDKENDDVAA
jgi:hypothetical protein